MGLLEVVRSGVKIADKATKSLQSFVTYERCTGQDAFGGRTYGSPVALRAIVEAKQHQLQTPQGQMIVAKTSVLLLDAVALSTATSGNGVNNKDRITLQDGSTGPIIDVSGFTDSGNALPLTTEVFMQ